MNKKNDDKKKKTISISIAPELYKFLEDETSNRSAYINRIVVDKLVELGIDVSKIKL